MAPSTSAPNTGAPTMSTPTPGSTTPPGQPPAPADATPEGSTWINGGSNATISVSLPADAKVFVNGLATTSTGVNRQFVSRGLQAGARYNYEVRAEIVRDGQPVVETKSVELVAGRSANLSFNFPAEQTAQAAGVRTSLVINVPADAKVYLSGQEMRASGPVRQFSTTRLTAGEEWNDYTIRATIERDGQLVTKERTISLKAGDAQELTLSFDDSQLAESGR
jgi:uncharacterized protein (TIGR03000 family)